MNKITALLAPLVTAIVFTACTSTGPNAPPTSSTQVLPQRQSDRLGTPACGTPPPGHAQCLALIQSSSGIGPDVAGWTPLDLQTRYNLPSTTGGAGQIVAIVDAFDNPNVTVDVAAYRNYFGLGTAIFTKFNQLGQRKNYPTGDIGWGSEIDLDAEMVSAVCPKCTIYLIEANSSSASDLDAAEAEAVTLGAHVVSNSWICYASICDKRKDFATPGVTYVAASGDNGYNQVGSPMAFASVVSVGGTVLSKIGSTYDEIVWHGTGSGCTRHIPKPRWQHDTGCTTRTDNDVAAVASGVAEYDTYSYGGWFTVGGTSVSAPLIAGIFGLAGNAARLHGGKELWAETARKHEIAFHDITSGSNGSCAASYLCTGIVGYDGPSGWGTPNGVKGF